MTGLIWWSRRSTSSDHQIIKGLHLLVSWRFFFAWMMCFYCVMCLCHYYLSFSVYSYLQFSIVQQKKEQLRAVEQQPTTPPFKETPYTPIPFWTRKDNQRQYTSMQSNIRAVAVGSDRYRIIIVLLPV